MKTLLLGNILVAQAQARVTDAMKRCRTGTHRLRAGFPKDWSIGDKTGTGEHGAVNDVAIAWRKHRSPLLVACFTTEVKAQIEAVELAHTRVARIVAETFG